MTPAGLVRPDDHRTLPPASRTSNSTKARRKPTPDGNFVPRFVHHGDARDEIAAVAVHARHRDRRGLVQRLVEHRVLRRRQRVDAFLGQHRIGLADAEHVEELLRHLEQEDVEADERVLGEAVADGEIDVLGPQPVLDLREVRVFLD